MIVAGVGVFPHFMQVNARKMKVPGRRWNDPGSGLTSTMERLDMSNDTALTRGQCGKCNTPVFHDGERWMHEDNNQPLFDCPIIQNEFFVYGIAWTRDQVSEPIKPNDVQWFDTYGEALADFNGRDDKYWPSVLVKASLGPVTVERRGTCPEYLAGGDQ